MECQGEMVAGQEGGRTLAALGLDSREPAFSPAAGRLSHEKAGSLLFPQVVIEPQD
jgi:hypothetical protein